MITTIIKPKSSFSVSWKELNSYRELFYFFAWRDIKVRYKQTILGAGWAIFQPFVTMVVFTIFFNKVAGIHSDAVPYAIFSYSGLLFWNLFSANLGSVSNSLLANQSVITKIYFPRIIVPVSAVILGLVDFFFASIVFVGLLFYFHIMPGITGILMLIPMLLLTSSTSLGLGLILAAMNVKYRDVRAAVPFIIQIGLFITPVIYPSSLIPSQYQWITNLNPMSTVINTMRSGLLHQGSIEWTGIATSSIMAIAILIIGISYFNKVERGFADII